jgi:hypothetical protein
VATVHGEQQLELGNFRPLGQCCKGIGDEIYLGGQSLILVASAVASASQVALGLVFGLASATKVRDPNAFVRAVEGYRLLPPAFAKPIAWIVMAGEAIVGLSLVLGVRADILLVLAIGLLTAFTCAAASVLIRGQRVTCGCFGGSRELVSARSVVRLIAMIAVAASLLLLPAITAGDIAPLGLLQGPFLQSWNLLVGSVLLLGISAWAVHFDDLSFAMTNVVGRDRRQD